MNDDRFMDMELLSKYIHIPKSSLYKMVSKGEIPVIKIGRKNLFDRFQIDNWVLQGGVMIDNFPDLLEI